MLGLVMGGTLTGTRGGVPPSLYGHNLIQLAWPKDGGTSGGGKGGGGKSLFFTFWTCVMSENAKKNEPSSTLCNGGVTHVVRQFCTPQMKVTLVDITSHQAAMEGRLIKVDGPTAYITQLGWGI